MSDMPSYITKPDWGSAFTGATHLLEIPATKKFVFAYKYKDDFYTSTVMLATFCAFRVIEERPPHPRPNSPTPEVMVKRHTEAQGIRFAVAHLKETHGGDRFASSAYLAYADELESTANAIS